MSTRSTAIQRITIAREPTLSHLTRAVVKAALNQRAPSRPLRRALNDLLDAIGDDLSTKRRKGEGAA